jgi:hypothetical protein
VPFREPRPRCRHRAAAQNVEKLVDVGILQETSTARRRRMFLCEPVIAVVEEGDFPVGV